MFGMNPIPLYAIVFLVFTNVFAGTGWWVASMKADYQQKRAEIAEHKLVVFAEQVRAEGAKAERRTAEAIANGKKITEDLNHEYAKSLDRLRADYQRLRKQYTSAGSGAVPTVPEAPRSVDEIPANALPLAAECAETTLTLETLQEWVQEQSEVSRE